MEPGHRWKAEGKGVPTDVIHTPPPRAEQRVNLEGKERTRLGTSLAVQWLGLCVSTAGGQSLISGGETKIPSCHRAGKKKKRKKDRTLFTGVRF